MVERTFIFFVFFFSWRWNIQLVFNQFLLIVVWCNRVKLSQSTNWKCHSKWNIQFPHALPIYWNWWWNYVGQCWFTRDAYLLCDCHRIESNTKMVIIVIYLSSKCCFLFKFSIRLVFRIHLGNFAFAICWSIGIWWIQWRALVLILNWHRCGLAREMKKKKQNSQATQFLIFFFFHFERTTNCMCIPTNWELIQIKKERERKREKKIDSSRQYEASQMKKKKTHFSAIEWIW